MVIKAKALKCLLCGDIVYSRTNHDYRSCYCKNVSVDAGPSLIADGDYLGSLYSRIIIRQKLQSETIDYELDFSASEASDAVNTLYNDWNKSINKYGLHRDDSYSEEERIALKAKMELL